MKKIMLFCITICLLGCESASKKSILENNLENEIPSLTFKEFAPLLQTNTDTLYVINFWATWCEPCVEELPAFEAINQEMKNQKFKMILVSLDFNKHKEKKLIPFLKKNPLSAQVIHLNDPDANAWIEKVDLDWSGSIPATLIFNKNKREFFEQTFTKEDLRNTIINF